MNRNAILRALAPSEAGYGASPSSPVPGPANEAHTLQQLLQHGIDPVSASRIVESWEAGEVFPPYQSGSVFHLWGKYLV
ncbi:hypothetical protein ACVNS2_27485 [Paenibacillus caseinilyticus]|uniref:Uncharacterized protein n=1 Tax=Paenibacillus mucilaginosus K02 TaxID=997761 RepID=I0BPY6_9BACL|nr:hypothetical protein [Paenibacillus mucilaginosus]AFH64433.1 hypothetical protein B2K_27695 [Paenibacillus mucilaginosus K02]